MEENRVKIAIQKKGRLFDESIRLLKQCGIKFRIDSKTLMTSALNLPLDILFVRDDDIPTLVMDGVCDLGIVGQNELLEKQLDKQSGNSDVEIVNKLGFGRCRLSLAFPKKREFKDVTCANDSTIATSYPKLLQQFLDKNNISAKILTISGSVEIAPKLNMADAICDLVSTGRTLEENDLREVMPVLESEAVLIKKIDCSVEINEIIELLDKRMKSVIKARGSKYIMFHAPKAALDDIEKILPGSEKPTIMTLDGETDKVAVHVVSSEGVFWDTLESLKQAGASSILVVPIEKMLE